MAERTTLQRVVFVTRPTWLEDLLALHGTLGQAEFYLRSRGQAIEKLIEAHERFHDCFRHLRQTLPAEQRRVHVERDELDRFLFAPDDVVVIVGQDGLVPNTAKYLRGQPAIGINPDPERFEGVLCPHPAAEVPALLDWLSGRDARYQVEARTLAQARREDGQELLALNEVFIGHQSHQSARYRLTAQGRTERQSSSGVICATGTGATGWVRSIVEQSKLELALPHPRDNELCWFVREPWPSVYTGSELSFGLVDGPGQLALTSEMQHGGVIFADGIEKDRLEFLEGQQVEISLAEHKLNLIMPPPSEPGETDALAQELIAKIAETEQRKQLLKQLQRKAEKSKRLQE
jgi:hypothetical protein